MDPGVVIVVLLGLGALVFHHFYTQRRRVVAAEKAQRAYRNALKNLAREPTAEKRTRALELGRRAATKQRLAKFNTRGMTHQDEAMIHSDLDAAGLVVTPQVEATPVESGGVRERLKELEELHADGILTDEEYESQRQRILDEL